MRYVNLATVFLAVLVLLASCKKELPPSPVSTSTNELPALRSDSSGCSFYRFDSALAALEDSTDLMRLANDIIAYAAPDTNTLGWTQARYVLKLQTSTVPKQPISVVYFHGGGADVGHAGNADADLKALLLAGFDVWSVEYRRGWHAGSYDACLPRDPFSATTGDLLRFDTAAVWAYKDAKAAMEMISGLTGDSLLLWGASFGAHLALALGPYADSLWSEQHRIMGSVALYGSVPPSMLPGAKLPVFMLHGEYDPVNGPDIGPLYGIGVLAKGSRSIYFELENSMPNWLITHPGGHSTAGLSGKQLVRMVDRSLGRRRVPCGAYTLDASGINPVP